MNPAIWVTSSRLVTALLFSFFFLEAVRNGLYAPGRVFLMSAIACVVLIELSDAFDGIIARKRNQVTPFGKIFDPLCDSVSRQTVFCTFMVAGIIPLWMFLLFLYRDAALNLIRIMCAIDGTVVAAKKSGKVKAVFQGVGIFLVLFIMCGHAFQIESIPRTIWGKHPGFWIMLFPALFTILSMFDYLIPNWYVVKKMMVPDRR
jgi:CDP-diacylglycerol--glycerol-3-phosphate 3-phosphatidyltransferase